MSIPMRRIVKYFKFLACNSLFRIVLLLALLMVVFNLADGHFIFVRAYDNQLNIYPSSFSAEQDESISAWDGFEGAFFQELSRRAGMEDFNEQNSAFIKRKNEGKIESPETDESMGMEKDFTENEDTDEQADEDAVEDVEKTDEEGEETNEDVNEEASEGVGNGGEESAGGNQPDIETDKPQTPILEENFPGSQEEPPFSVEAQEEKEVSRRKGSLGRKFFSFISGLLTYGSAEAVDFAPEDNELQNISQKLIFSDFSLPGKYSDNKLGMVKLRLSLAGNSRSLTDIVSVECGFEGEWSRLGAIDLSKEVSNRSNNDYFQYVLPNDITWEKIDNMEIRLSYESMSKAHDFEFYLDALWLEVDYASEGGDENGIVKGAREMAPENDEFSLKSLSGNEGAVKAGGLDFRFKYERKKGIIGRMLSLIISPVWDEYGKIKISADIYKMGTDRAYQEIPEINYLDNGEFEVGYRENPRRFSPGAHRLKITIQDNGSEYEIWQDFSWGVLAFNAGKSAYAPGETAFLQMGVVNDYGHTVCNADLKLEIAAPNGEITSLTTANGLITANPACDGDSVIEGPDYSAYYLLEDAGVYNATLSATTDNGERTVREEIYVVESLPFDIERQGPTRIYPPSPYEVAFTVVPKEDFKGEFREYVPISFSVEQPASSSVRFSQNEMPETKTRELVWEVDWMAGETYVLSYIFDAPDISPGFYLLGPAKLASGEAVLFEEYRQWQIAADDVGTYDVNGGSSNGWTTPSYAWDSNTNSYASRDIPRRGVDDSANYLLANSNTAPSYSYTITKVEIGIEGYVEQSDVNMTAYLRPVFGGSTLGGTYSVAGTSLGTSDSDATFYQEITADANAPSTWTWNDVQSLDIRVYGNNTNNGQPSYLYIDQIRIKVTYDVPNDPPTGTFNSAEPRTDGSGIVDISIEVDDPDDNDTVARLEYESGSTCAFSSSGDPTIDTADANTTADYGDPEIDNSYLYQIGTTTGYITTASGSNTVLFDWLSGTVPSADGTYCLRLTVNDSKEDQAVRATTTVVLDNVSPTAPGNLSFYAVNGTNIVLNFGASSTDSHFDRYEIHYRQALSGAVLSDTEHEDANLSSSFYNNATSTVVDNLMPNTDYVFNIWAFDSYGNIATATAEISTTTPDQEAPPIVSINFGGQNRDGSKKADFSINVDDGNDDDVRVKMEYEAGTNCLFIPSVKATLDEDPGSITVDNGTVIIENDEDYQIGTSTGMISTLPGANNVGFTWLVDTDLSGTYGTYCVRLTGNDGNGDQTTPATALVEIDTLDPSDPGPLTLSTTTDTTVTLEFGDSSADDTFREYVIYYKEGISGVATSNTPWASSSDPNLGFADYNLATTTTITGLLPKTFYVFNIWAYDAYGNLASSSAEVTAMTGDPLPVKARTVKFLAGTFSGNGTAGANSDTSQTLPSFNFRLAENSPDIRNAYIILEAQFESYANNAGNYTGYELAFDACAEPCAANAFTGTGRVLADDNTVLAYDGDESNQVRLLLDVTEEAQLAAYGGASANLEGQVGYRFERGAAVNSISYASAVLAITYEYDESQSEYYTNTVYYPLESTVAGDSGTRRSSLATINCTPNSDCPLFGYNAEIPDEHSKLTDWFQANIMPYNNNPNRTDDISVSVNIQSSDVNSYTFVHENANAGTQGTTPTMYFGKISGYSANTSQTLEIVPGSSFHTYSNLGGEVAETYIGSSSAAVKTKTVSFPIGVVNNGNTTAQSSQSVTVFFPENGASTGNVTVKKAWIRAKASNASSESSTVTLSTAVGDNPQSANWIYAYQSGATIINPPFTIVHVIPSADYAELSEANISAGKTVTAYVTNGSANQGGVSAELMITYAYTDEANGYLTTLELFAGQSSANGNSQLATSTIAEIVAPESSGIKTVRAAGLFTGSLLSDSDAVMPGANFSLDANLALGEPTCSNAFLVGADTANSFADFNKRVYSSVNAVDGLVYTACYSNNGGADTSAGGKPNGYLVYTYQYAVPPPETTQNDWRWYENSDSAQPGAPKAGENEPISGINLADIVRLRINIGVSEEDLAAESKTFKLQYGQGSDCTAVSAWSDVGGIGGSEAWIGYDNLSADDGTTTGSALLGSSDSFQSYEESNPSEANPLAINIGQYGEWDWVLYNNSASSSKDYCFKIIENSGAELTSYNSDGYAKLATAATNTPPNTPTGLGQYKNDGSAIANYAWINQDTVKLQAQATDININEDLTLYFEVIGNADPFTAATSVPAGACASGTDHGSCASRIWTATSATGDYRSTAFIGTTTVVGLPDNYTGYKWQVMACDDTGGCSNWTVPAANPNFRVDKTPPSLPGALTYVSSETTSMTLNLGATSTEPNFSYYRIYYQPGSSGVSTSSFLHVDANLNDQNYNGALTTTINSLSAGTQYVFNIWAFDLAGNAASATPEFASSTISSFTPPTGFLFSASQITDGSGAIQLIIQVDDPDNDDTLRAKIDYVPGIDCNLAGTNDPTLNEDPATISVPVTHEPEPVIDNTSRYQVGSSTGWIRTSPGENFVFFQWLSKSDIQDANSTYCIRLLVNDGVFDQAATSSKLLLIDNTAPTPPGPLTEAGKDSTSVTLNLPSVLSTDSRFSRYRIFYSTSTPPTVDDHEHADSDLLANDFNLTSTTTVSGLAANTTYYFDIWAYDQLGNRASSSEILSVKTNGLPYGNSASGQYREDETTAILNGGWNNGSTTKLVASALDPDASELVTLYFEFLANGDIFTTATSEPANACVYGTPFGDCNSKIWFVASTSAGNWSVDPYTATASISAIPDSENGYKWQVLACDDTGECSNSWNVFNPAAPNVRIDANPPSPPGALSEYSKTPRNIVLSFGSASIEDYFREYIVHYSSSTPLTESSASLSSSTDPNLASRTYGGAATTTITGLSPDTDYYINIWAYDKAGHSASSTQITIRTNAVASTPGVIFYTRNTRVLYYRVWTGNQWGPQTAGPNLGSAAGDNIRSIRSVRSDDGSKVAVFAKTWDGTNQEWWATVYRTAADDFVNTAQLGIAYNSATNNNLMTGCLAALSDEEFFVVRNNNGSDGTLVYSWNVTDGWSDEGSGPDPAAVMNGCALERRPGTDNYVLLTYDDDGDVGTSYYYGGPAFANSWTTWTEHSTAEEDIDNYVGEAFFDPSDNTRGGINYRGAGTGAYAVVKKFICSDNTINFGNNASSPATWSGDWVHGEFAVDPDSTGKAFFIGDDVNGEANVYQVDITGSTPVWAASTNGDDISGAASVYNYANASQKPYDMNFYKNDKGVAIWNSSAAAAPSFRTITASANSVSASNSSITGATADTWSRVRIYDDPNENEFAAVFQNTSGDYAAVFWDGLSEAFHTGNNQAWTELATAAGPADADEECASFAYTAGNFTPYAPTGLKQYRNDGLTEIANGGWNNGSSTKFVVSAKDADTSEILHIYLELITNQESFVSTTSVPANACASTTAFDLCNSKIWLMASSSAGDYSLVPYTATATISSIPDSTSGYKWQVKACDDEGACSSWIRYNTTEPNFKVDTFPPSAPGALSVAGVTSQTVSLNFGATSSDENFSRYRIYYRQAASGVTESHTEHIDSDLGFFDYNGTTGTVVSGLSSSTVYVFNIWAYDLAGNKATATPEVATTTAAGPYLAQVSYLLENDDGADVNSNTADAAIAAPLNNLYKGERLNVRFQIENTGGDAANSRVYKLQFENQTDNPGVWTDVGAATAVSHESGLSGSNGAVISSRKAAINARNWVNGAWYEDTNLSGSFSLVNGFYSELVFAVHTGNAVLGKTYRLRLYDNTSVSALQNYASYPAFSIAATDTLKYSKAAFAALPLNYVDLTYYLDPEGYGDVSADDSDFDSIQSVAGYPIYNFSILHTNSTDAITAGWTGSSSVSSASSPVYLQVFRFGTTNAWQTVASSSDSTPFAEFSLTGGVNSSLSQYYLSNRTYWRVYQASGDQTLSTDRFNASFAAPVPYVTQKHYRWRDDDNGENSAAWLEDEDTGNPTDSSAIGINENIRLRFSINNTGGGSASNYAYRIEYASTTGACEAGLNWRTITPYDESGDWTMATSTHFTNGDLTTSQLTADGYAFTAGSMVENPAATSSSITLSENRRTEVEYAVYATANATQGGTYCFRTTNNGAALDRYEIYPILTISGITNSAPYFTVTPTDNGSASSSPTNYGSSVYFSAEADDYEGDSYYLAICRTNSITSGNDSAPTCNGGALCMSDLTASNTPAECSYTASDAAEEVAWYAFVCDKYPGFAVAKCSPSSQGAVATPNGSPLAINHPPVLTSVSTTDNNKDPGGTFTITAVSYDNDIAYVADTLTLFVCRTDAATVTGCEAGQEVCSAIGTSSPNASCQYTDTAPTPYGDYDYYAFLFDNHNMPADGNSEANTYTINNTPPQLGALILNGGNDITLNMRPATTSVSTVNTSVVDKNGCSSIVSATAVIYMSNATNGFNCVANDNDCYRIGTSNCIQTSCVGEIAAYTCTTGLKYFAIPTDDSNGNPFESYNWLSYMNVYDGSNYSASTSPGVELKTTLALNVLEDIIDFGDRLYVGDNTGNDNSTTTIVNAGNSPVNTNVSGTDMEGTPSGTLAVNNMKYNLNNFNWVMGGTILSGIGVPVDISAPRPTSDAGSQDEIYWGIGIPLTAYPSVYFGNNTFEAFVDGSGW